MEDRGGVEKGVLEYLFSRSGQRLDLFLAQKTELRAGGPTPRKSDERETWVSSRASVLALGLARPCRG